MTTDAVSLLLLEISHHDHSLSLVLPKHSTALCRIETIAQLCFRIRHSLERDIVYIVILCGVSYIGSLCRIADQVVATRECVEQRSRIKARFEYVLKMSEYY